MTWAASETIAAASVLSPFLFFLLPFGVPPKSGTFFFLFPPLSLPRHDRSGYEGVFFSYVHGFPLCSLFWTWRREQVRLFFQSPFLPWVFLLEKVGAILWRKCVSRNRSFSSFSPSPQL